ncbi:hypothetical protein Hdeb2414_s0560g00916841 [Helianthus debilis subsp. tardiflorus]
MSTFNSFRHNYVTINGIDNRCTTKVGIRCCMMMIFKHFMRRFIGYTRIDTKMPYATVNIVPSATAMKYMNTNIYMPRKPPCMALRRCELP